MSMHEYGVHAFGYVLNDAEMETVYRYFNPDDTDPFADRNELHSVIYDMTQFESFGNFSGSGNAIDSTGQIDYGNENLYDSDEVFFIDLDSGNVFEPRFKNMDNAIDHIRSNYHIEPRPEAFRLLRGTVLG